MQGILWFRQLFHGRNLDKWSSFPLRFVFVFICYFPLSSILPCCAPAFKMLPGERNDTEKDKLFPGISVIQNGYHELSKDRRKSYLQRYPQLESYREWNRQFQNEHPEYVRWNKERSEFYNESTCYETYAAMSRRTQKELESEFSVVCGLYKTAAELGIIRNQPVYSKLAG